MPIEVDCLGAAPPRPFAAALAKAGITLHAGGVRGQAPCVVVSSGGRRPRAQSGRPWIWVGDGSVTDAMATEAVLDGAYDVVALSAPDAVARIAARVRELLAIEPDPPQPPEVVALSAATRRVLVQVARAARTSMAVLLSGETGTGKEMMARLIHRWSSRHDKLFVPLNCAAIPNELMEAELFGYARGAFTGAARTYAGQISAAEGRTVFLDELDDTPPQLQAKLLRVLEDRVVRRPVEDIIPAAVPRRVLRRAVEPAKGGLVERGALARRIAARSLDLRAEIDAFERAALTEALALAGGNAAEAARLLGTVGRGSA